MALDIIVVMIYTVGMLGLGWYGMRRAKTHEDYLVAGRNLGPTLYMGTMATTVLKPGGYQRFNQIGGLLADIGYGPWQGVDQARVEPVEHGHRVRPLEVLQEVVVVEHDVVVAQAVQGFAGEVVAQQGGVALHVGI